jgi:hypothetical protein
VAIILFRCPYCGKKVETSEDNVGREGLCPGCQKIFEIPMPDAKAPARAARPAVGLGLAGGAPLEYEDPVILIGVGIVALGLLGLLGVSFLDWVRAGSPAAQLVGVAKVEVLVGAAVSLAFLAISALTRSNLMPSALAGGAWGMFSLIWTGTVWRTLGSSQGASPVASGTYLAMAAAIVAILGAAFVYYQVHSGTVMERFGLFLVVTQVAALAAALLLASHYLKPGLSAGLPQPAPVVQQPVQPAPRQPAARQPAPRGAPAARQQPAAEGQPGAEAPAEGEKPAEEPQGQQGQ